MLFDQKANLDTGGTSGSGAQHHQHHESKVIAPRNPTLNRGPKIEPKVCVQSTLDRHQPLISSRLSLSLVYTFNIFKRNVIRYSTEINEYQRNVSTENHRPL